MARPLVPQAYNGMSGLSTSAGGGAVWYHTGEREQPG